MIEELEPGAINRSREFRAKYPGKITVEEIKYITGQTQKLLMRAMNNFLPFHS